jgi:carnitine O-acetyltransferase
VASSKHRQTQRFLDTLEKYLVDVKTLLLKEKYPTGLSQRQRVLAMEEAEMEMNNGYSYFDNGDQSSDNSSQSSRRRVGKRLVLHKSEE